MTATRRALHPALVRLAVAFALACGVTVPHLVSSAGSASAAVPAAVSLKAVKMAATRKGARYHRGSVGPRSFDCSGLTKWSYAKVGRHLPRSSQAQWRATQHIKRSHRRAGDLVFFFHGRRVYHVAIYAGHNTIWHAPRPGKRVKKVTLWTSHVRYGRVR